MIPISHLNVHQNVEYNTNKKVCLTLAQNLKH